MGFHKDSTCYSLGNGVDVNVVYEQLNKLQSAQSDFKWNDEVKKCWILSVMDESVIYYAAPQLDDEYVPHQQSLWISVHGSLPAPEIYVNLQEMPSDDNNEQRFDLNRNSLQAIDEHIEQTANGQGVTVVDNEEEEEEEDESLSDLD